MLLEKYDAARSFGGPPLSSQALDSEMKNNDFAKGCLLLLPLPFLFVWFLNTFSEVAKGNAPNWKIVAVIACLALYGLVGGLGKAFEAGFSHKHLFGLSKKMCSSEEKDEDGPSIYMLILVLLVFGGIFIGTFLAIVH